MGVMRKVSQFKAIAHKWEGTGKKPPRGKRERRQKFLRIDESKVPEKKRCTSRVWSKRKISKRRHKGVGDG